LWDSLKVLKRCHTQALVLLNDPRWPPHRAEFVVDGMLRKHPSLCTHAHEFITALRALYEEGSQISPLIWTYWRISFLVSKGYSPYALKVVWSARVGDKKVRRYFYEDSVYRSLGLQPLWPVAASQLLGVWDKLTLQAYTTEEEAQEEWERWRPTYEHLLAGAREQSKKIAKRIGERVVKFDIKMWYPDDGDLLKFLKLKSKAAVLKPAKRVKVIR